MNPTSQRGPRREEARIEILEAAAAAIATHGYHGMSMRKLACATGRGLANFYNYFSSKEDLLFSLQRHAFETLNSTATAALRGIHDTSAQLYVMIFNHLSYVAAHPEVMYVLVHEASALPPARRKIVRILKERYFQTGEKIVSSVLIEESNSVPLDPAELERSTYSVFGMLNWSYGWYDPKRHGTPREVATTIHRIAISGLSRQRRPLARESIDRHLNTITFPSLIAGDEAFPKPI